MPEKKPIELFKKDIFPDLTFEEWLELLAGQLGEKTILFNPTIVGGNFLGTTTIEGLVYVTYTFYDHIVDAGTGQGHPATIAVDRACTIREVYAHVETAPGAGKTLTVDINKNGTTIFTTQGNRPSITETGTTDVSGTPDVVTLAKNDLLTMDVDTDDGVASKLSVYVRCQE